MGSRLTYYLFILPISVLPYTLLYLLSDAFKLLLYYVIGYRKEIVLGNIRRSFPDKSPAEHNVIMRKFYGHFCDLVVESFKGFTVSEEQLRKRVIVRNPELVNKYYHDGLDVIFVGGHFNNWEIGAQALGMSIKHLPIGIYKPLHNIYFDTKMKTSRERYRLLMVPMSETRKTFESKYNEPNGIIFGIDQSPGKVSKCYWTKFLNQDTPVAYGVEKYAKEYDRPIIHTVIHKVKRGFYEIELRLISEKPNDLPYGAIIEKCTQSIERDIVKLPEYWLWTHRRWKHKRST